MNISTVSVTSLVVQWLRLHSHCRGVDIQFLVRELRSHKQQGQKKKSVTFLINTFKEQVSKKTKKDVGGKLFFRPTSSLELALGVDQ